MYTIGPQYAYAEARKAPSLDGRVRRDAQGKELRYPVLLTAAEKAMARSIVLNFGQSVCGFDLLRAHGKSYVCDVNGWSFVKSSSAYYLDAAQVLRKMALASCRNLAFPPNNSPAGKSPSASALISAEGVPLTVLPQPQSPPPPELRVLVALVRHGDRTPKQKLKMNVRNERMIVFFNEAGLRSKPEIKLKRPRQLQQVLDLVTELLDELDRRTGPGSDHSSDADLDGVAVDKLRQLRQVLSMQPFSGINRKIQVKRTVVNDDGIIEEALLVMKWGGELTAAGRQQAESLGRVLRRVAVSGDDDSGDLLHLHSTYRHDLKFYSSEEGRVQVTAAAVAKGMLELEGELTPILVSLVRKDGNANDMLDDTAAVADQMTAVKRRLHAKMQLDAEATDEELQESLLPGRARAPSLHNALLAIENPLARVKQVHLAVKKLTAAVGELISRNELQGELKLYHGETLYMLLKRYAPTPTPTPTPTIHVGFNPG